MRRLKGGSSSDHDTYFAILLMLGFGNVAWFLTQGAVDGAAFFFCVYAVGHFTMKKPYLAVAAAIVASNLFVLTQGVREGLEPMKKVGAKSQKGKVDDKNKGAPAKAPAPSPSKPAAAPAEGDQKDAFTDMFGSESNLEKLMQRQTQLMSQLKNMAPLMQSAKEALKQLPSGYLEKALKTLKTNMAKEKGAV